MTEARRTSRWRQVWPWLVGLAIVIVLATRVPFDAFGRAIHEGPHLWLAVVDLGVIIIILLTDTVATWASLIAVRLRWSMRDALAVRGATYVVALLNYAVGQGGVAYYLHKGGVSGLRAAGITLFMMGTTFATLLLATTLTWLLGGDHGTDGAMWWTLVAGCVGLGLYLAVIALAPAWLARRELLAPLFDARVRGHVLAILARVPHVAIIVLGHWFALIAWGIPVPFVFAAATMPLVVIATVLPISPAGLGTTQAALVYFFSDYAGGATDEARAASVLAFAIVHFVYGTVGQLIVGLACIPMTRTVQPPRSI